MTPLLSAQTVARKILMAELRSGRLSHAYLFKGPKGSGKSLLARKFAQGILCENQEPGNGDRFGCGECRSCREVETGSHPDVFYIEKDGSSIKIKASHDVLREALMKPFNSRWKVFIVQEAENLTLEAANALLKILEEPPPYVIFILTTANIGGVPDTVISRCQVIPFRGLPTRLVAEILTRYHGIPEEDAENLAKYAGGSVEKALSILSLGEPCSSPGRLLIQELRSLSPVELARKYAGLEQRALSNLFLSLELEFSKDLNVCIERLDESKVEPENEPGANQIDPSDLSKLRTSYKALDCILTARERLESSVNAFLTLTALFFDLERLLKRYEDN
ncbi:MAG: DNA polymerase III subunit delta' [Candidatus Fermentithermobacillus carboniphilus]|uniref:DNA polymerase III subunit delta n=1 Tax=Candidatus Fermentithermobacillus carboniphilus TaxID=3085328 RepID=A0AAT9LB19_9FIRM|nr:MAG: DNA polymerase III subunit delta' [Candidatus Fermentithermobacillus carboniphilus]